MVENFSEMLESSLSDFRYKEGEIIKGTVLSIVNDTVVVDVGLKSEGRIPLKEFHSPGEDHNVKIGDEFDVYLEKLENKEGEALLSRERARKEESWSQLEKMQDKKQEIMGVITGRVKGGFAVDINGAVAFLPGSQVDLKPIKDISPLLNKSQPMVILKMDKLRGNIVVSRRALLEESRKADRSKLLSDISEGDKLKGNVKNITDYGDFVDLGGLDGLVHVTDLSWERVNHPSEMFQIGQEIEVMVTKYDTENNRISLGIKQLTDDPWHNVEEKYKVGNKIKSKITSIADYGAFVEVDEGIEGLVHVSEMSWSTHLRSAQDFVSVGDEIEAVVLTLDRESRKMSLGIKQLTQDPWTDITNKFPIGSKHIGSVRNFTNFGVFIELEEGIDGLIYISDLSWTKKIKHPSEFLALNDKIEVVILDLDVEGRKLSLGHKQTKSNPWDLYEKDFALGTLHNSEVSEVIEKGAIINFNEDISAFCPTRHLDKEDGSKLSKGDKVDFKVIEFSKEFKRVVVSHLLTHKDSAPEEPDDAKVDDIDSEEE